MENKITKFNSPSEIRVGSRIVPDISRTLFTFWGSPNAAPISQARTAPVTSQRAYFSNHFSATSGFSCLPRVLSLSPSGMHACISPAALCYMGSVTHTLGVGSVPERRAALFLGTVPGRAVCPAGSCWQHRNLEGSRLRLLCPQPPQDCFSSFDGCSQEAAWVGGSRCLAGALGHLGVPGFAQACVSGMAASALNAGEVSITKQQCRHTRGRHRNA